MSIFSGFTDFFGRLFSGGGSSSQGLPGGNRLYVGNLSYRVKEEELRSLFSKYGKVKALHLIRDRLTRRLKGYAFVEMSPADAPRALALNGIEFLGRKLVVSIANVKKEEGARRHHGHNPNRFKKRRSGPRVYGESKDKENDPVQRLE